MSVIIHLDNWAKLHSFGISIYSLNCCGHYNWTQCNNCNDPWLSPVVSFSAQHQLRLYGRRLRLDLKTQSRRVHSQAMLPFIVIRNMIIQRSNSRSKWDEKRKHTDPILTNPPVAGRESFPACRRVPLRATPAGNSQARAGRQTASPRLSPFCVSTITIPQKRAISDLSCTPRYQAIFKWS